MKNNLHIDLINNTKIKTVHDKKYNGKLYEFNFSILQFIFLLIKSKSFVKYLQEIIINESMLNNKLFTVRIIFCKISKNKISSNIKFIIFHDSHIHKITRTPNWNQFNNQSKINKPHAFRSDKNKDTILIVPHFSNSNFSNISSFAYYAPNNYFYKFFKLVGMIILYNLGLIKKNPNPSHVDIKRDLQEFWLSFHGGSVPWLHARLDTNPIYFPKKFIYLLN